MAENGAGSGNEFVAKAAATSVGAPIHTTGIDAENAVNVDAESPQKQAPAMEIPEHGMDAEAIAGKAAESSKDVEKAIEDGARYVQAPNNVIQPGVNDPGKYVRSTELDKAVARAEASREGEGTDAGKDRFGRDSKGRVPFDQPLSDELIDSMSRAELEAVATDRGYKINETGARRSFAAGFKKAQSESFKNGEE